MITTHYASPIIRTNASTTLPVSGKARYYPDPTNGVVIYRIEVINCTGKEMNVICDDGTISRIPSQNTENPNYHNKIVVRKHYDFLNHWHGSNHQFFDAELGLNETPVRRTIREFFIQRSGSRMASNAHYNNVYERPTVEFVYENDNLDGFISPVFCAELRLLFVSSARYKNSMKNPVMSSLRRNTVRDNMGENRIRLDSIGLIMTFVDNNNPNNTRFVNLFGMPFKMRAIQDKARSCGVYLTYNNPKADRSLEYEIFPFFIPIEHVKPETGFYNDFSQAQSFGDTKLRIAQMEVEKQLRAAEEAEKQRKNDAEKRKRDQDEAERIRQYDIQKKQKEADDAERTRKHELIKLEYEQNKRAQEDIIEKENREHEKMLMLLKEEMQNRDFEFREQSRKAQLFDREQDRTQQAEKIIHDTKSSKRKNFTDTIKYFVELIGSVLSIGKLFGMLIKFVSV